MEFSHIPLKFFDVSFGDLNMLVSLGDHLFIIQNLDLGQSKIQHSGYLGVDVLDIEAESDRCLLEALVEVEGDRVLLLVVEIVELDFQTSK